MREKFVLKNPTNSEVAILKILNKLNNKSNYTLQNLANKSFTSPATILRVIKKLGFINIYEFKYFLNKPKEDYSDNISRNLYKSILKFHQNIEWTKLMQAAKIICDSKIIVCYGDGRTQILAQELAWDLNDIGIRATHNTLNQDLSVFLDKNTTCLIFTKTGKNIKCKKFAKESAYRGANVITITTSDLTEWSHNSNLVFKIPYYKTYTKLDEYVDVGISTYIRMLNYHLLETILNNKEYQKSNN